MDCNKNQISAQLKCTVVVNNFNLLFIFLKNVVWEDYKTKNNACLGMALHALVNKHMKIVSSVGLVLLRWLERSQVTHSHKG